jgi:hypothetical protein
LSSHVPWEHLRGEDIAEYASVSQLTELFYDKIHMVNSHIRPHLTDEKYREILEMFEVYDVIMGLLQEKKYLEIAKLSIANPSEEKILRVIRAISDENFNEYMKKFHNYLSYAIKKTYDEYYFDEYDEDDESEFREIFIKMFN